MMAAQPIVYITAFILFAAFAVTWISRSQKIYSKDIPFANPSERTFFSSKAKMVLIRSSKQILAKARRDYPNKPFRLLTDWGEVLILPPTFADEIRNEPKLSFSKAAVQDNHGHIPGFETVGLVGSPDQLIQTVARKQITKHLAKSIEPLSREMTIAVRVNFGESADWMKCHLKPAVLDIIARLSSRIYLGDQLCRHEGWLRITKTYTATFLNASTRLRMFPKNLRFLVHWLLPECKKLRTQLKEAHQIILPLVRYRQVLKQAARNAGQTIPQFDDALEWAEQEAAEKGSKFDPAVFQLTLSLLAIHATYDLLEQSILDLARNPQYIEPLRQEVIRVLRTEGWKKTSLYNMKVLDSALKETQRLKPGSIVTMRRYVTEDLTLSNGLVLRKGTRLNIDNSRMEDPAVYENPEKYDPYRFYNMRQEPGKENLSQLVSTSPDHLGFGHGQHSCPGRFFAANEIKVALCHILVKYEWKLDPETDISPNMKGMLAKASSLASILIRKRGELEIDLDSLSAGQNSTDDGFHKNIF